MSEATDQDAVSRVLASMPPGLRETLADLAGAPWETVVTVFGLLPYDQWAAAMTFGLGTSGAIEDPQTGVRPVVPTEFARRVIASLQAPESGLTLEDARLKAKLLLSRLAEREITPAAASTQQAAAAQQG